MERNWLTFSFCWLFSRVIWLLRALRLRPSRSPDSSLVVERRLLKGAAAPFCLPCGNSYMNFHMHA